MTAGASCRYIEVTMNNTAQSLMSANQVKKRVEQLKSPCFDPTPPLQNKQISKYYNSRTGTVIETET
uniref:Uncharacterized protein n=1 Tax=Arundo donax TaxID=35708 RepID=A0A0A9H6F6_ARUDO